MKNKFFGIYYKHQTVDGYTLAVIDSISNEGKMIQIITNERSYLVSDLSSVKISFERIIFDINQEDLLIKGTIEYGPLLKNKKDIMSYYRYLPIECKHQLYSMYHSLKGKLLINNKEISFDNGNGYIEGDKGRNFPKKYLWLNAINEEASLTLAVATIPLGLFKITGITSMIEYKGKEYRFGTYNNAKVIERNRNHITIKKGRYLLDIEIKDFDGHKLKAPVKGNMVRYIHECPSVGIIYTLKYKDEVIMDITHPYASFEYVFDD